MNETIESPVFGSLRLEREVVEQTTYTSELKIPTHGCVTVAITSAPNDEREWNSSLRSAEQLYSLILQDEFELRQQARERLLAMHRDYWGRQWRSMPASELLSCLRLKHLNFFSDGTIELWYAGGESFQHHDIHIDLDRELHITEIALDG